LNDMGEIPSTLKNNQNMHYSLIFQDRPMIKPHQWKALAETF